MGHLRGRIVIDLPGKAALVCSVPRSIPVGESDLPVNDADAVSKFHKSSLTVFFTVAGGRQAARAQCQSLVLRLAQMHRTASHRSDQLEG
ncbi:unnamed protein product [Nippostrongylus brasiliensis]|uniref:Uncharacterized protein n=1 Tax=Nippostrongylus brasiliensis TaxID=27835 RepID=A0A0N4YL32_NIPBR|nr:unnamed protein product [Nippostrongylus brasiliensis]